MTPRLVGLTGGIGAGKSTALRMFADCGAATLSSDEGVHRAYEDREVRATVAERFGAGVMRADGTLDRPELGRRAFAEEGGIAFLEGLVHPRVGAVREAWVRDARARRPTPPLLVCEVPLLYEVGLEDAFDAVLVVTACAEVRRARVAAREGGGFDARSPRQLPEHEKARRADHAFVNAGPPEALRAWVAERFAEYAGAPCPPAR